MSAAEKLKALDAAIRIDFPAPSQVDYRRARGAESLALNALPQIVAVVEAAEKTYDGWLAGDFDWDELVAALAALDEALSPPTGGSP